MRSRMLVGVMTAGALVLGAAVASAQSTPSTMAAAAAKDSPELVGLLSNELGSTPEQAAGAAGSLFGLAKTKLNAAEFSKVAAAVPGMVSLLKAAPHAGGGAMGTLGAASGLAGIASSFRKLGLKPELVAKAVPVLTSFVTKSGGADVGNLLAGVLK